MTSQKYSKEDSEGKWVSQDRYLELTELKNKYYKASVFYKKAYDDEYKRFIKMERRFSQLKGESATIKKSIRRLINISFEGKLTND